MKKILIMMLAAILTFSFAIDSIAEGEATNDAVIVNASQWAIEELNEASVLGLISDRLSDENLTLNVSRAEFALIAVNMYEALTESDAEASGEGCSFSDIEQSEYKDVIISAYSLGIVNGITDDVFSPDSEITREQMAAMLMRALNAANVDTEAESELSFADSDEIADYAKDAVCFMSEKGIINGVGDDKFAPKATATREQAILISYRCVKTFKETKETLGSKLWEEFKKIASENPMDVAQKLSESEMLSVLPLVVEKAEPGLLAGFGNNEIKGFAEGVKISPVIGTIPFVAYVFTLDEKTDAESFMKNLEEASSLRWNICVSAEEKVCVNEENKVFFVMCPIQFEE